MLAAILSAMVRLVAPVLTFTSEEIWQSMPESLRGDVVSVQLAGWPTVDVPDEAADRLRDDYRIVLDVRDTVTKSLEDARGAGSIGKSQEARVVITAPESVAKVLSARPALADLFITGQAEVVADGDALMVAVLAADGVKCPRCWNLRTDVGSDPEHAELCGRCARVVAAG